MARERSAEFRTPSGSSRAAPVKPVTIKNFPKKAEEKAKAGELVAPMRYVYDPRDRSPVLSERLGSRRRRSPRSGSRTGRPPRAGALVGRSRAPFTSELRKIGTCPTCGSATYFPRSRRASLTVGGGSNCNRRGLQDRLRRKEITDVNHPDTESIFGPFNDLAFANLEVRPELLTRSTDALRRRRRPHLRKRAHDPDGSRRVEPRGLRASRSRVTWHDDEEHCRLGAIGCRCDLGRSREEDREEEGRRLPERHSRQSASRLRRSFASSTGSTGSTSTRSVTRARSPRRSSGSSGRRTTTPSFKTGAASGLAQPPYSDLLVLREGGRGMGTAGALSQSGSFLRGPTVSGGRSGSNPSATSRVPAGVSRCDSSPAGSPSRTHGASSSRRRTSQVRDGPDRVLGRT